VGGERPWAFGRNLMPSPAESKSKITKKMERIKRQSNKILLNHKASYSKK
jgi:hypothetical protein